MWGTLGPLLTYIYPFVKPRPSIFKTEALFGTFQSERAMRDDRLAKRMFLGGCFGLPLLWFFNVLYFRKEVYGPNRFLDSPNEDENEGGEAQTTGISTDGIPNFGSLGINSTESDSDDENSDEGMCTLYCFSHLFFLWTLLDTQSCAIPYMLI